MILSRCKACNDILTTEETIRKSAITKEYLDLCDYCLGTIADQIPESIEDEYGDWEEPNELDDWARHEFDE